MRSHIYGDKIYNEVIKRLPNYKFILADKSEFTIDKMRMKDKWGIILFDVNKNPNKHNENKTNNAEQCNRYISFKVNAS